MKCSVLWACLLWYVVAHEWHDSWCAVVEAAWKFVVVGVTDRSKLASVYYDILAVTLLRGESDDWWRKKDRVEAQVTCARKIFSSMVGSAVLPVRPKPCTG